MNRLSVREQRMAALLILLVAIALIWLVAIRPIARGFADRAAQRDLLLATYARDNRILGQLPSIARAAAAQRRAQPRFRLPVAGEAEATSALIERLNATVTGVGGEIGAVEPIAATPGVARARVECRLTTPQLAALLQRLQNGAPLLMVDVLAIGANVDTEAPHRGPLDVRVEASVFLSGAAAQ